MFSLYIILKSTFRRIFSPSLGFKKVNDGLTLKRDLQNIISINNLEKINFLHSLSNEKLFDQIFTFGRKINIIFIRYYSHFKWKNV